MELREICTLAGSGLLLILSFIKIPKIEVNVWGWLARSLSKAFSKDIVAKIDIIGTEVNELSAKLSNVEKTLDKHVKEDKLDSIRNTRCRILRFHDELRHGTQHTEEHYNEIISDIDIYEDFCSQNPDYPNMKAEIAIKGIKQSYEECIKNNSFLT